MVPQWPRTRWAVCLLAFAGSLVAINSAQDPECHPQTDEELIWDYEVRRPYRHMAYQETEAEYGPTRATITCVEIRSLTGTPDADVWITSGGVGEDFVKLKFRSKFSRGFVYKVSVYGRAVVGGSTS